MKKYFLSFAILLFSVAAFAQDNAPLPNFKFTDTDGKVVSPATLEQGKPVVVVYFDPDCDHCQQQAEWVRDGINLFKDIQLVWVSWGEADAVKKFEKTYFGGLEGALLHVTNDTEYSIDNWFGYSEVPSIYVYNSTWTRTKTLRKETPATEIVKWTR